MYPEIRRDVEDTRPFGGARKGNGGSGMVGALNRGVRVEVDQLYCSEELANGQGYDIAYLAERAGVPRFSNFESAFELTLQGSIVSLSVWVASSTREAPDDSGTATRVDYEMKAHGGEGDAEKNEDQGIAVHWACR